LRGGILEKDRGSTSGKSNQGAPPANRGQRRPPLLAHHRTVRSSLAVTAARLLSRFRVVLVSPKSPGNVGAAARAVKNLGLGGLAVIEPVRYRDPEFFRVEAGKLAVHAGDVLARLRIHATLELAIRPRTYVVATTAKRGRNLPLASPREAARRLLAIAAARPVALLFGPEDRGLPNRLIARASEGLRIPTSPRYPALNLAQAVAIVGYELRVAAFGAEGTEPAESPRAKPADLDALHHEAGEALRLIDFLKPHNRERIASDLAALLARARPGERDARMLRGICRQVRWLAARAGME
jgi:tRNA/rRNA methyltransferase